MRIAILSDIHANLQALEAVAKDAEAQGIDETWCLGDVVGYGGNPRETLRWVEQNADVVVRGNHDQAVSDGDASWFNPVAATAARAHAQLLEPAERARMAGWPLSHARTVAGERVLVVHASPDDPLREYVFPESAASGLARWSGRARIILLGHTHVPFAAIGHGDDVRDAPSAKARAVAALPRGDADPAPWVAHGFEDRRTAAADAPLLLVNAGSVGQPRDGNRDAAYVLLDMERHTVELRRVPYDVEGAAAAVRRAGLPDVLATRLLVGR